MSTDLPPGLAGFVSYQQENDRRQLSALQQATARQGLLAQAQEMQSKNQMRQLLAETGGDVEKALQVAIKTGNIAGAHQLAPLVKLEKERKLNEAFASTQGGNQDAASPDRLDAMAAQLAAAGHPGAAAVAGQAEKRRKAIADAETLRTMQSRPEVAGGMAYGGAGDVAEQTAQPAQPGLFASLAQSPHGDIAQQAKNLQKQMDSSSARSLSPQYWQSRQEALARQHEQLANKPEAPVQTFTDSAGSLWERKRGAESWTRASGPGGVQLKGKTAAAAGDVPTGLSNEYKTDETYKKNVDFWAAILKDGGSLPPRFAQSGSGKKMMPDILNVVPTLSGNSREMLANQVDLTGQKSEARAVGARSAAVEMAAGEAREMMPILLSTSENFKRTGYQPINQVFKNFQDKTGSVESRQFGAALNSFVNVYARAVSPSGVPTVSDKDHAREVLSTADSHEQLVGLLKVLDKEMVAAQNAPRRVRDAQRADMTGAAADGTPTAPPAAGKSAVDAALDKYK